MSRRDSNLVMAQRTLQREFGHAVMAYRSTHQG